MTKKCSTCGSPAPDDNSVFCNRCGARLPSVPACRKCGNTVTDPLALFCDRCGSPLAPAAPAVSPAVPAAQRKTCPSCGYGNSGENLFYCKKCGGSLLETRAGPTSGPAAKAPVRRPAEGGISIIPDGMDALRQGPVNAPAAARRPPGDAPVAIRRPPAKAPGAAQVLPRQPRPGVPTKRDRSSGRKVAIAAAGIILIILVIAVIAVSAPAILKGGSANATETGATASNATASEAAASGAAVSGTPAPGAGAPGLFGILSWGATPTQTPVINQATPVVTDTPLTPAVT